MTGLIALYVSFYETLQLFFHWNLDIILKKLNKFVNGTYAPIMRTVSCKLELALNPMLAEVIVPLQLGWGGMPYRPNSLNNYLFDLKIVTKVYTNKSF